MTLPSRTQWCRMDCVGGNCGTNMGDSVGALIEAILFRLHWDMLPWTLRNTNWPHDNSVWLFLFDQTSKHKRHRFSRNGPLPVTLGSQHVAQNSQKPLLRSQHQSLCSIPIEWRIHPTVAGTWVWPTPYALTTIIPSPVKPRQNRLCLAETARTCELFSHHLKIYNPYLLTTAEHTGILLFGHGSVSETFLCL